MADTIDRLTNAEKIELIDSIFEENEARLGKKLSAYRYNQFLHGYQLLVLRHSPFGRSLQQYGAKTKGDFILTVDAYLQHLTRLQKMDFEWEIKKIRIPKSEKKKRVEEAEWVMVTE